jgi:hypothetical protein
MPYNMPVQQRPQYNEPVPQHPQHDSYGEQGRDLARRTSMPMQHAAQPPASRMAPQDAQTNRPIAEYEDLAKWTLDLANARTPQETPTPEVRPVNGASACEDDPLSFEDIDADANAALHIARDLANISVEDEFETPSFLRVKEDTANL